MQGLIYKIKSRERDQLLCYYTQVIPAHWSQFFIQDVLPGLLPASSVDRDDKSTEEVAFYRQRHTHKKGSLVPIQHLAHINSYTLYKLYGPEIDPSSLLPYLIGRLKNGVPRCASFHTFIPVHLWLALKDLECLLNFAFRTIF